MKIINVENNKVMKSINEIKNAPRPVGPYSPAVVCGGMVYVSGQIGIDPGTGRLVDGGIESQTSQVLSNLAAVIAAAGSTPDKIVMTTIFLVDIADGKVVNELYRQFVNSENLPARQTVAVKALPLGALIEISVIVSGV